ncbi:hypothetical protein ABK040_004659 [Willaertia magna]
MTNTILNSNDNEDIPLIGLNSPSFDISRFNNFILEGATVVLNNVTNNNTNGTSEVQILDVFFYVSLGLTLLIGSILTISILRYYTKSSPFPWFLYFPLFITYLLLFTAVSLVCIDLAGALSAPEHHTQANQTLVIIWRVIYWSLQALSWVLLPFFQGYLYTGEFKAIFRWLRAIADNLINYGIMLCVGGVALGAFCIYIAVSNANDPEHAEPITFAMIAGLGLSLSNIVGLALFVTLVGFGLVSLPRAIWDMSNDEGQLRLYEYNSPELVDDLEDKEDELVEYISICRTLDAKVSPNHKQRKNVDYIMKTVEEVLEEHPQLQNSRTRESDSSLIPPEISKLSRSTCVKIHRLLQRAIREFASKQYQWKHLQRKAFILQDIIESKKNTVEKRIESPFRTPRHAIVQKLVEKPEWFYYKYFKPWFFKIIALSFVPFSIILIWCEFTPLFKNITATKNLKLSLLELIVKGIASTSSSDSSRFVVQFVSLFILALILSIILFSLFRIRILYLFQMVPHHTDAFTLFYTGLLLCRTIPAMCYNFLQLLGITPDDGVAYYAIYGALRLDGLRIFGVLGGFAVDYFPLLIILIVIVALLRIIERLGKLFNLDRFKYSGNITEERVQEGRELLKRARKNKLQNLQSIDKQKIASSFDKMDEHAITSKRGSSTTRYDDDDSYSHQNGNLDVNVDEIQFDNELNDYEDDRKPIARSSSSAGINSNNSSDRLNRIYEKHKRERPNTDYLSKFKSSNRGKQFDSVL